MTPAETLALTIYDYQAALHHHNLAHSPSEDEEEAPLGAEDFDEMMISLAGHETIN